MLRETILKNDVKIVGIAGKKGCGKSTFARGMSSAARRQCWRMGFADALREAAKAVFGSEYRSQEEKAMTDAYWADRLGEKWSTGRKILQHLGTEVFRDGLNENIWLYALELRILRAIAAGAGSIAIDDVRYDNEAQFVKDLGGSIVLLTRPDLPASGDAHRSEVGISPHLIDHTHSCNSEQEVMAVGRSMAFCMRA